MKRDDTLIVVLVGIIALVLVGGGGMMGFGGYGMMSGCYGGFGSMWLFGWLFRALVFIALILAIIWLVRQLSLPGGQARRK